MGMVYVLRRATPDQLALLRTRPQLIERFLFDEPREAAVEATGLMDRLRSAFRFSPRSEPIGGAREDGDEVYLDKSWHLMHFLLTGSDEGTGTPTSFLNENWPEIGDRDIGWGRAWAIEPDGIRQFNDALRDVREGDLCSRFDVQKMKAQDVYLADAFEGDEQEGCNYVLEYLTILRTFVAETAKRGCGAIGYLT
jgi:hypothetical protein